MEENKEVLELLRKLDKSNRRQTIVGIIQCVLMLATALCCVVTFAAIYHMLPQLNDILLQINETIPQINTVVEQMQSVLSNLELATEQLAAMDFADMINDVDALVISGQQSLEQTMEKLNTIDFEALNKGIRNLEAVVEPLAKFFNVFK